jgi:hypothetical protein
MSRLHSLAFIVRGALLNRELDALRRRAGLRPHVPSAYLVPGYPLDPVVAPGSMLAPWGFVIAILVAFTVGGLVEAEDRLFHTSPAELRCIAELQDAPIATEPGGHHEPQ